MGGAQNGNGAPAVINQAIAPVPSNAMSPTTNGSSVGIANQAAANSSTVQLSPASSISSLSSSNGVSAATALPLGGASSSPTASSVSGSPPNGTSPMQKSNYGLITITKGKSNIVTTRCVKLLTAQAVAQQQQQQQQGASPPTAMSVDDTRLDLNGTTGGPGGRQLQHSSSASAVVNLGILTPATSPRNGQQQQMMGGSATSSGCSSMESLPLTPVSPTIGKDSTQFVTTQDLISANGGGGNSVLAQVSALMSAAVGDSDDHNMSDDT